MAGNGDRDDLGRFKKGWRGGPGRPRRVTGRRRAPQDRAEFHLPSEPEWDDGLPRIRPLDHRLGCELGYSVVVPGGQVVAALVTEQMAKEFVGFLGREYAARAESTMKALDQIAETIGPVPYRESDERWAKKTLAVGAKARRIFKTLEPPAANHPWRRYPTDE